jgi:hypothetical protein
MNIIEQQIAAELQRITKGLSPLETALLLVEGLRDAYPEHDWRIEADGCFRIVRKSFD